MGLCFGSSASREQQEAQRRSDVIDREIFEQAKKEQNVLRILLLGAGESGKSTLVKQMKLIHGPGFSQTELQSFKPAVLDNLLSSMKCVLHGMGVLRINLADRENKSASSHILSFMCGTYIPTSDFCRMNENWLLRLKTGLVAHKCAHIARVHHYNKYEVPAHRVLSCSRCVDENHQVIPSICCALNRLWADAGVRAATDRGFEFELNDSAHYFFEHMVRILSAGFCPTVQDVLRVRVRTTGILETHFQTRGFLFRVYDVGGLRTERSKWIRCFEDVNAVLFVVALNGYSPRLHEEDVRLYTASHVNRLQESMTLYASVCNSRFFRNTSMILFLNKMDLFQQMILHSERHLRFYFPKYTGADCDAHSAAGYIASLFFELNRSAAKCVYHHFTTAIDTANMQVVFQFVMETIIKDNLQAVYLL